MNESTIKGLLIKAMKLQMSGALIFRHEDRHLHGVPDISCTWLGHTTWWEVKRTPFERQPQQELRCQQLAQRGYCQYIIFKTSTYNTLPAIYIVQPKDIKKWDRLFYKRIDTFNYQDVSQHIQGVHHALGGT